MANNPTRSEFEVWQWNCRGFRKKKAHLQQFLASSSNLPAVIALQETHGLISFPGYNVYQNNKVSRPDTAILMQKHLTANHSQFDSVDIEHDFLEIIPRKNNASGLYIPNIYSRPEDKHHRFDSLFAQAIAAATHHPS